MAIHSQCNPAAVLHRSRLGLDLRDEEWDGVYHVTPAPSLEQQRLQTALIRVLGDLVERHNLGTLVGEVNVWRSSTPRRDYRIPDLVVEIRSPGTTPPPSCPSTGPSASAKSC